MNHTPCVAIGLSLLSQPLLAAEGGFFEDAKASLSARNYYFSRDYSDIVGANQQSKAEEWAQGFILDFKSGYTPGPVGFGVDTLGLLGIKLDSSPDRANLGYFTAREDGDALLGNIDNQTFFSLLTAKHGGHSVHVGYQGIYGERPFPRVFANISPLGNEVPTYEFAYTDERSYQVRYDYNFAAMGVPGLTATVRYITGNNVDTGLGYEGKDRERDLDIGYAVQGGVLKGLGIRVRNAMARSNYRSDIDENRLILMYTWQLF